MINSFTHNGSNENKENMTSRQYIYSEFNNPISEESIKPGKQTSKYDKYKIKCPSVHKYQNFQFNIIDSPGYGSDLNNEIWVKDILQYINKTVIIYNLIFSMKHIIQQKKQMN